MLAKRWKERLIVEGLFDDESMYLSTSTLLWKWWYSPVKDHHRGCNESC